MASGRILRLKSMPTKAAVNKKGTRLTETECQLLLAELADLMIELDELSDRAAQIAARVKRPSSAQQAG